MSRPPQPVRSMTGFARVRREAPGGEVVVSVKSVNHRGLDIRFRLPAELEPFENALRTLAAQKLARGHVEIRVAYNRAPGPETIGLNRPLLAAYVAAFRQAAEEFGLSSELDLNAAFRVPGMLGEPVAEDLGPAFEASLLAAFEEALGELNAFREREGAQLAAEIRSRIDAIRRIAASIGEIRSRAVPHFQARLEQRLSELLEGAGVEPQRLAQEAAILADRSDVGEEVSRLEIHAGQLAEILAAGGEVGKRMDFLLQEMHRETNTILSKTSGVGEVGLEITDLALAAKAEIEKIREQALNLE